MSSRKPSDSPDVVAARHFAEFAGTTAARAPLYAALSTIAADTPSVTSVLEAAPPMQRLPVLFFAAVHRVLFDHPDEPLAGWYPNLTPDARRPSSDRHGELAAAFVRFAETHDAEIRHLVATRSTQTNEVGRCGFLLPALDRVARELDEPLAVIDVGTSGGLNLLVDRFAYRFNWTDTGESVEIGDSSTVTLAVDVRGEMPIPRAVPIIGARIGLDREPLDVTDPDQARWLEACVWPDQTDRFERLVAAIELFGSVRPPLVRGDAIEDLASTVERVSDRGHPVVMNTWVLSYLTAQQRHAYLGTLDDIGTSRDLSWVWAEAPALVPELPTEPDPRDPQLTVLTLVRWRAGTRTVHPLATCHPHGYWLHWR